VEVERGLAPINAGGFSKEGNVYTNEAYGQTDVALRIQIETGVGAINLELGE